MRLGGIFYSDFSIKIQLWLRLIRFEIWFWLRLEGGELAQEQPHKTTKPAGLQNGLGLGLSLGLGLGGSVPVATPDSVHSTCVELQLLM